MTSLGTRTHYLTEIHEEALATLTAKDISDFRIESLKDAKFGPVVILDSTWFHDHVERAEARATIPFISDTIGQYLEVFNHELENDDGLPSSVDDRRDKTIAALNGLLSVSQHATRRALLRAGMRKIFYVQEILRRRWPEEFAQDLFS